MDQIPTRQMAEHLVWQAPAIFSKLFLQIGGFTNLRINIAFMVLMKIAQIRRWVWHLKVDLKEMSKSRMKWIQPLDQDLIIQKFKPKYSISLSITKWIETEE